MFPVVIIHNSQNNAHKYVEIHQEVSYEEPRIQATGLVGRHPGKYQRRRGSAAFVMWQPLLMLLSWHAIVHVKSLQLIWIQRNLYIMTT